MPEAEARGLAIDFVLDTLGSDGTIPSSPSLTSARARVVLQVAKQCGGTDVLRILSDTSGASFITYGDKACAALVVRTARLARAIHAASRPIGWAAIQAAPFGGAMQPDGTRTQRRRGET